MTDDDRLDDSEERIADLVDAGLVEATSDEQGEVRLSLTAAGQQLGRALFAGSEYDPDDALARLLSQDQAQAGEIQRLETSSNEPMTMRETFGTSLGSAMLGFEQALRREPPAEVLAAEHVPERDYSGAGTPVIIEFPDDRKPSATDDDPHLAPQADDGPASAGRSGTAPDDAG